ncbi:MAG: FAD-dependent oxidoreductase, partial [Sphingomonadales bacterium]
MKTTRVQPVPRLPMPPRNDNIRESNLWRASSRNGLSVGPAEGDIRADVAVVGGGILGLATALRFARAGASVIVLESDRVGEGASSRAGGFVVPHFTFGNPRDLIDQQGEQGEHLVRLVGGSAARVFDLIAEHGIACDAQQGGWYQPAHCDAAREAIEATARAWQDLGFGAEILDAHETTRRTGVPGYR